MPDDYAAPHAGRLDPAPRPGVIVSETFPADPRWVRRIIHKTMEELNKIGIDADDVGTVEIVLAEALNNIVEHAYDEDDKSGEIKLVVKQRSSGLMVEVSDKGHPMPNGRAPLGNHPMSEFNNDPMPEGGYGWFLIRELVRDLIYDRRDGQNFLVFRIAVGSNKHQD